MQNKKALVLLISANIISGFAQGISMLSIPWYFTSINKNESLFAAFYGVLTLLMIPWSLYSGTLIDKYSRKKIFIYTSAFGFAVLLASALHGFMSGSSNEYIVLLVFATTIIIYNIHYPNLYAFGQEIAEKHNYGKMNSYFEIQGQATTVIAGAVGAILLSGTAADNVVHLFGFNFSFPFSIKAWTLHEIFLMDASTYAISILLIGLINYQPLTEFKSHSGTVMERMRMGFAFLKEHKLISLFGNMSYAIFVFLLVEVHLLMAWYTNNYLNEGAGVYASAEIMYAVGALFAGVAIRKIFKGISTVRAVIIMMVFTFLGCCWVAVTKQVWIFYVFSILIGITNAGTRVLRVTWLFNHIPNNMMGRTGSVFQVVNILLRFGFVLLFSIPFFSQGSNVIWAYLAGGVFVLLSALPLLLKVKQLDGD